MAEILPGAGARLSRGGASVALALVAACASAASAQQPMPSSLAIEDAIGVTVPAGVLPPAPERSNDPDEIVVTPWWRQIPLPAFGNWQSRSQRMAERRALDRCIMAVANAQADDPLRPQFERPGERCPRRRS